VSKNEPKVAILMGSDSDWEVMQGASKKLDELGIAHEVRVSSAHRTPKQTADYVEAAPARGVRVFIAAAGAAAHLAGAVAANTSLPVIGVPLGGSALNGMDALLSTVQMPKGVPVATVAIGAAGAENAALLAAQILAIADEALAAKLVKAKKEMAEKVVRANEKLQGSLGGKS
jgi:phosphoribosylaminoimidazole carboxylase PurE protein